MEAQATRSRGGIGFFGLLTLVFITLKLCGVINWSWWLVLAPFWIPLAMLALIVAFMLFCLFMAWVTGEVR